MREVRGKVFSFLLSVLSGVLLIGVVAVAATGIVERGNGWSLVEGLYYSKTWEYDETKLDKPDSFYSLPGWHTNNTQDTAISKGESSYGVGTRSGTNGKVGGTIYLEGDMNLSTGSDVDLYVSWERNHYTIIYDKNNVTYNRYGDVYTKQATGTTNSTSCRYDTEVTLAKNGFTREGYTFVGWNTMSDGTGMQYAEDEKVKNLTSLDGDTVTLYAIWEPIRYTVYLHENTPTDATNSIVIGNPSGWEWVNDRFRLNVNRKLDGTNELHFRFDDGNKLPKLVNTFNLKGWKNDNTWYSEVGTNGEAKGNSYGEGSTNLTTVAGKVIDLYPRWIKHTYTINYSGNDTTKNIYGDVATTNYSGSTSSTPCKYDTDVTLAVNGFTKSGYEFKEWNTKSDGTGNRYASGAKLTKPNFTDEDGGTVTLYAIWEPLTYNVVLDPNGGTFNHWNGDYPEYYYNIRFDQCAIRDLPTCSISNHAFLGWGRFGQSIDESIGNGSFVNKFYYWGNNKRIYISADKSKAAHDVHFNPLAGESTILYGWYNTIPTFADVYDGQFFEGQRVSYSDLIDLVSVFDYEDDYYNTAIQYIYNLPEVNIDDIYLPIHPTNDSGLPYSLYLEMNVGKVETGVPPYVIDDKWVDNGDGTYTEVDTGDIYYTVEKKMELESLINASDLVIEITDISYGVKDGVRQLTSDSKMGSLTEDMWGNKNILESNYWLDTSTDRIDTSSLYDGDLDFDYDEAVGEFKIAFKVTDNGIMCGGDLISDSPVTMEYERKCVIQYNAPPQIYIRNVTWYEDTTDLEDISSILSNQLVLDSEDCVNNPPWWYTNSADNTTGISPKTYHGNSDKTLGVLYKTGSTYEDLQLTLKEEYVWGVVMNPYLDRDHTECNVEEAVSSWVNGGIKVADIVALKGNPDIFVGGCTKAEVYDAILSFNVCLDAKDQWGKWASGRVEAQNHIDPDNPSVPGDSPDPDGQPEGPDPVPNEPEHNPFMPYTGQPRERRSVTVYKVSTDTDVSMSQANVQEEVRFINDKYITDIQGDGSYWGDSSYGYSILTGILSAREESRNRTPVEYGGSYTDESGHTTSVKVNDYTE